MMSRLLANPVTIFVGVLAIAGGAVAGAGQESDLRVVVVTGGHGFDQKGWKAMWKSFDGLKIRHAQHKKTAEAFSPKLLENCDVVVLYDMAQKNTDEQRAAFKNFVKRGGGVVALHHCLASHPTWPDWERIIGGKYLIKAETRDGQEIKSGYEHGVDIKVHVADPDHPITRGLKDFTLHDEIYWDYVVAPDVHVLLTTDNPKSNEKIAWCRREGKARIVYIQSGHDNHAFADANYRKLLEQAIHWAAGRDAQ